MTAGLLAGEGKMDCDGVLAEGWKVGMGCCVCDWDWVGPRERGLEADKRAEVLNVEELERVGEGWTGPSWERRALKVRSGSEASRVIARKVGYQLISGSILACVPASLDPLASVWGWTIGPVDVAATGLAEGAFDVLVVLVWGGTREGYFRTVPLAARDALEVKDPILENTANSQCASLASEVHEVIRVIYFCTITEFGLRN